MTHVSKSALLLYTPEQVFALVEAVERYPEFLPWVVATRIKSDSDTEMVADMMVGFSALREKFTSRVLKDRPRRIAVEYLDGPLKRLSNTWAFADAEDGGCVIHFNVDFTFRSAIFEALAGQYLDRAFRKMVAAFETRAEKLYGSRSSSATTAA